MKRAMFSNISAFTPDAMKRLRDTIDLTAIIPERDETDEYCAHFQGTSFKNL